MPAGLSGQNAQKLNAIFNESLNSGLQTAEIFAKLQNIDFSAGGNLRRIGQNIGFSFETADDELYKKYLKGFIALKTCNGSAAAVYTALDIFDLNIKDVDLYEYFGKSAGLAFDASWLLDSRKTMNSTADIADFITYVDFHREKGSVFEGAEAIVEYCRPPVRQVIVREVFELLPELANTEFSGTLFLDAEWALDAERLLNPYREGTVCRLLLDGNLIEEESVSFESIRVSGREWQMETSNYFDEIQIWDREEQMAQFKLPAPIRFYFAKKIIIWRYATK